MVSDASFLIEVWDGATDPFTRLGRVGSYEKCEFIPRYNEVGAWKFTLSLSDGAADLLLPPDGKRITISYLGKQIMSGPATGVRRAREGGDDSIEVYGIDDLIWLFRRLGVPSPLASFPADGTAFTQAALRDTITDNAESMIKHWVTRNCVTRLPVPTLSVATDLGRGAVKTYGPRFETVLEAAASIANTSGLGLSLVQVGDSLEFDVYEPSVQPVRLSRILGNLEDWEYVGEAPAKTRLWLGGSGDDIGREYMLAKNTASEVGWGITEQFLDATSADDDAAMYQQGVDDLAENGPTASFSVTPVDTEGMRFGETYGLGDQARVELFPDVVVTDVVRQVTITDDVDDGLKILPVIGNLGAAEKSVALYRQLIKIRAQLNRIEGDR